MSNVFAKHGGEFLSHSGSCEYSRTGIQEDNIFTFTIKFSFNDISQNFCVMDEVMKQQFSSLYDTNRIKFNNLSIKRTVRAEFVFSSLRIKFFLPSEKISKISAFLTLNYPIY